MAKYIVSSSPHISTTFTTRRMMLDVIIALVPATIASVLLYGFYPFCMMVLCVGSCVFAEWLFNCNRKKISERGRFVRNRHGHDFISQSSARRAVLRADGWRFLCNRDCEDALWRYRQNFANPAITARIFLLLCWTTVMTSFVKPIDLSNGMNLFSFFDRAVDADISAITSATPLAGVKSAIPQARTRARFVGSRYVPWKNRRKRWAKSALLRY